MADDSLYSAFSVSYTPPVLSVSLRLSWFQVYPFLSHSINLRKEASRNIAAECIDVSQKQPVKSLVSSDFPFTLLKVTIPSVAFLWLLHRRVAQLYSNR